MIRNIVLIGVLAFAALGCASEGRHALNTTADFFIVTSDTLVDYRNAGEISDTEWKRLSDIRTDARVCLDEWRSLLDSDQYDLEQVSGWRDLFNDALSKLIEAQLQAERQDE